MASWSRYVQNCLFTRNCPNIQNIECMVLKAPFLRKAHFITHSICIWQRCFCKMLFCVAGAFLIPYFIFLFVMGMPLVMLEMAYGQFSSLSPIAVWKMAPLFEGTVMRDFCCKCVLLAKLSLPFFGRGTFFPPFIYLLVSKITIRTSWSDNRTIKCWKWMTTYSLYHGLYTIDLPTGQRQQHFEILQYFQRCCCFHFHFMTARK